MKLHIGDIVRYLNAVGGGRVVRIVGDIAYVDEDGFETPVLSRECVVVNPAKQETPSPKYKITGPEDYAPAKDAAPSKYAPPTETPRVEIPIIETPDGDNLNIMLAFTPTNIKALSQSNFEAYIVNDSNYFIFLSIASGESRDDKRTLRFSGVIEPNIQEFLWEFPATDLAVMDRLSIQYVAYKRDREYIPKRPGELDIKLDTTKFARLHCFRPNKYFDEPVIAVDIATDDHQAHQYTLPEDFEQKAIQHKATKQGPKQSQPSQKRQYSEIIEVDLHASELLDSTTGLGPAEILNYQIEQFCKVMDANLRRPGQKIVFIHGKGEGVLRQAIMKELNNRYKGHDVQDASFREYGFGATQVTIRSLQNQQNQPPHKGHKRR